MKYKRIQLRAYFEQEDMYSIVEVIMFSKLVFLTDRQMCYNSIFF